MADWAGLMAFALSLDLPRVTLEHPWRRREMKADGRMGCWLKGWDAGRPG